MTAKSAKAQAAAVSHRQSQTMNDKSTPGGVKQQAQEAPLEQQRVSANSAANTLGESESKGTQATIGAANMDTLPANTKPAGVGSAEGAVDDDPVIPLTEHQRLIRVMDDEHAEELRRKVQDTLDEANLTADRHNRNYSELRSQVAAGRKRLVESEKRNKSLTLDLDAAEIEIDRLQDQLKGLQASVFKTVDAAQWVPESTSEIEAKLTTILSKMKQWSEKYHKPQLLPIDPNSKRGVDVQDGLIRHNCVSGDKQSLRTLSAIFQDPRMDKKLPSLMLSALAAHFIFQRMFSSPWFAFRETRREANAILMLEEGEILNNICEKISAGELVELR